MGCKSITARLITEKRIRVNAGVSPASKERLAMYKTRLQLLEYYYVLRQMLRVERQIKRGI